MTEEKPNTKKREFPFSSEEEDRLRDLEKEVKKLRYENWEYRHELEKAKEFFIDGTRAPKGWMDDEYVRRNLIEKAGGYRYLRHELKCDIRMIKSAYNYYRYLKMVHANVSWQYIPEEAKKKPEIAIAAMNEEYGGVTWKAIPKAIQSNLDVAWHAVSRKLVKLDQVPFLIESSEHILHGLNRGSITWGKIPDIYKTDIKLARKVTYFKSYRSICDIFESIPALCNDVKFWMAFINEEDFTIGTSELQHILKNYATQVWNEASFVRKLLNPSTNFTWGIISATLKVIPKTVQLGYKDLMVETVSTLSTKPKEIYSIRQIALNINPSFWSDNEFATAWFSSSQPFFSGIHDKLVDNKDVFLLIAKHCRWVASLPDTYSDTSGLEHMGTELLSNRTFLLQMLEHKPKVKWHQMKKIALSINPDFWLDDEFVMAWFSSSQPFIPGAHDKLANNKEVFLMIAKRYGWKNFFQHLGTELNGNRAFLLQMLEQNPRCFPEFPKIHRSDPRFALLYIASSRATRQGLLDNVEGKGNKETKLKELQCEYKKQKAVSDVLFRDGIFFNLDNDTVKSLKSSIADYLGLYPRDLLASAITKLDTWYAT